MCVLQQPRVNEITTDATKPAMLSSSTSSQGKTNFC